MLHSFLFSQSTPMFTCVFQDWYFPISPLSKHSPSLWKASRSTPSPYFSNCRKNDVTSVHCCLAGFRKKNCILLKLKIYWKATSQKRKKEKRNIKCTMHDEYQKINLYCILHNKLVKLLYNGIKNLYNRLICWHSLV